MSKHTPIPDDEYGLSPEFTALMERADQAGIQLADTFKDAEDQESLMMALVVAVSKCIFTAVARSNNCSTVSGFKQFLIAQQAFLSYYTLSHSHATAHMVENDKELAESMRNDMVAVADVEIN